jgi:UDP-N-acetylglucosamine--N-acetylmuramyl-(pentapeptide) pyrophosphoryl-undecaprenol N-acetylglucosamine transferase
VRREVLDAAAERVSRRASTPRGTAERRTVLVVGGSQGALGLNAALRRALGGLSRFRERIHWIHLAGDADKMNMSDAYAIDGSSARVLGFSPDLPRLMAESDLVIARAGGTTLAELAVIGVPSVLVPYPHHRDAHQLENARHLVDGGAAVLVPEASLDAEILGGIFDDILFAPKRLEDMGTRARGLARPDAADAILNLALSFERPCPQHSGSSSSS